MQSFLRRRIAMEKSALAIRRKSPTLAGVLSALICGLGQVYTGRRGRGVMLFLIFGILVALASAVWIFGVLDAFTEAHRINRG
jgi:TM2 domain-containing membrane protein YozV